MNGCPDLLAALRTRERDLEMDVTALRARLDEVREMIAIVVGPPQRRRRRTEPAQPPQHVPGAIHEPPDDDELPFQSDAPGA